MKAVSLTYSEEDSQNEESFSGTVWGEYYMQKIKIRKRGTVMSTFV